MLNIKIHRGTHQIGGSITEIYTENTHIFIDFGSELNTDPTDSTDAAMIEMMRNAKCDAVLFTHYHGDHIGLIENIPEKDVDGKTIRLGMGKTARQVLLNIHKTLTEYPQVSDEDRRSHEKYISILKDQNRQIDIVDNEVLKIGDFEIIPIMVDHSAYDAYMFIIKANGKVIVHTGDFRTHGRRGKSFFEKLKDRLKGINVDVLIIEGTMISRIGEKVLTEEQLQGKAIEILQKPENKYAFLICSSTNVESQASFANAAMKLGRAFYVNYYVYEQIQLYRETAGRDNTAFGFWKTYKFEYMDKYNPKLGMTQPEFMRENGFLMLIGSSSAYEKRISEFRDDNPLLIYSMWDGYVKKGSDTYDEKLGRLYHDWPEDRRKDLHTSGHATADDIKQMILTVNPQKHILPIHTEKPEKFKELDIGEYADKIAELDDSGILEVGIPQATINNLKKLMDYEIIIDGKKEKPIVIMPPDGSNPEHFRIYAFGGGIGRVPIDPKGEFFLANKDYSKYISYPEYKITREKSVYIIPDPRLLNKIPSVEACQDGGAKDKLDEYLKLKKKNNEKKKNALLNKEGECYLPLILAAARNRFTSSTGERQERWTQHEIAKYYQTHTGIKKDKDGKSLVIYDVEFDIGISDARKKEKKIRAKNKGKSSGDTDKKTTKSSNGASKPDFMMFDGESFGIVELKYLGKSMDTRASNALDWHYLDFLDAIKSNYEKIYSECVKRLGQMIDAGIIGKEWQEKLNSLNELAINDRKKIWFGFLFVGGSEEVVYNRIKSQLLDPYNLIENDKKVSDQEKKIAKKVYDLIQKNPIDLRCQYCEYDDNHDFIKNGIGLDMSADLKTVYEGLLKKD